jgi:hypothetical protein
MKFFKNMMEGANGGISSKRFVGLMCTLSLIIALFISMFSCGEFKAPTILIETIGLLAFGSLGLTSVDFFTNKKKDNKNQEES